MSDRTHFGDYQRGIYAAGLKGQLPELPLRLDDLERLAAEKMTPDAYWYVAGGAGEGTMRANREAFDRFRLVPRMLTDVSRRDLGTTVLGQRLPVPLLLAPIGVQGIVHPEGELATAAAAAEVGVPMILSTVSSKPMEAVAETLQETPRWFQLYWPSDDAVARSFLQRAEAAGYSAIMVTLDTKMLAWRERDLERAYLPFLRGEGLANYVTDPIFREGLEAPPEQDMWPAVRRWGRIFSSPEKTWDDLARLREWTRLPIVLKGILHPEDALRAVAAGVDGIVVSNHGGRQVDGSIAALDALPEVVDAVAGRIDVLFDSGLRCGSDVLKAIALGADAVLLGRPYIWGLATAGAAGVAEVLRRLLADIDLSLALCGFSRLDQLNRSVLRSRP
ncbi:MAG: alpha-hydroxy-acid oxidizing protein [Xanthomonadaceae bacterium]|nr:alpha-hydroxy-acid oxidizing protein [Xanthomonadaceae bacterium]